MSSVSETALGSVVHHLARASVSVAVLLVTGCGAQADEQPKSEGDARDVAEGEASEDGSSDVIDSVENALPLCSGLDDPTLPVLAATDLSGTRVAIARADGQFTVSDVVFEDGVTISAMLPTRDGTALVVQHRDGSQQPTHAAHYDFAEGIVARTVLDDAHRRDEGPAIVAEGPSVAMPMGSGTVLWRADGSWTRVERQIAVPFTPVVLASSPWLAVQPAATGAFYNFDDHTLRELSVPVAEGQFPRDSSLAVPFVDDKFYYLSANGDVLDLVVESFDSVERYPTGIAATETRAYIDALFGPLTVTDGTRPRWIINPEAGTVLSLDPPAKDAHSHVTQSWVLWVDQGLPLQLLDTRTGETRELAPDAVPPDAVQPDAVQPGWTVYARGDWFLGVDDGAPVWLVHAATGELERIDSADFPTTLPWPCESSDGPASRPGLFDDGVIGASFRSESEASFYVRDPAQKQWLPLGKPFSRIRVLGVQELGPHTFRLDADLTNNACGEADELIAASRLAPRDANGEVIDDPNVLGAAEMQIARAGMEPLILPGEGYSVSVHSSGLCLKIEPSIPSETEYVDVESGSRFRLNVGWGFWL